MINRNFLLIASLALPLSAQDTEKSDAVKPGSVASFYKAYFLDKEQPNDKKATTEAIELYQAFLANNKDHALAGRAAANCVVLLYSTGDVKKAESFAKDHGKLMAAVESKDATRSDPMQMFRGFGRGGRGGGDQPANPNQDIIDKLMGLHETADETQKIRLAGAITRLGGQRDLMMARFRGGGFGGGQGGGRGGFGGGRGGRGGGLTKPNIADMSQADAKQAVERFVTSAERTIDFMAQRGQADQADALEAQLDKVQDLVDDGKMKEAQKIIDSMEINAGGRGGGQGGERRRRGGDAGGAGGDAGGGRRRRGGDTGGGAGGDAGGQGGERRRRG